MLRQARLDAPGMLHHVMIREIERFPIFEDDQDQQDFISRRGMLAKGSSGFAPRSSFRKLPEPCL